MLSTKAIANKKITPDFWLSSLFAVDEAGEVIQVEQLQSRFGANICLVESSSFWHARRRYQAQTPFDLWRIFNAEKASVGPIEGVTFFRIVTISFNRMEVDFFVLPQQLVAKISEAAAFVYPIFNAQSDSLLPLDILRKQVTESQEQKEIFKKELSWLTPFSMFGLKIPRKTERPQLNYKRLGIQTAAVLAGYMALSSAYILVENHRTESLLSDNRSDVNSLLQQEMQSKKLVEDYTGIVQRKRGSIKPVEFLAALSLDNESVVINRVIINENTLSIWGETTDSSTKVLEQFIAHSLVEEASFSSPVASVSGGRERFAIEAKVKS